MTRNGMGGSPSPAPLCPLCSGREAAVEGAYSAILDLPGNSDARVLGCACGAYYLWPPVPDEMLQALYGRSYFTGEGDETIADLAPASHSDYESEFAAARLGKFAQTVDALLERRPRARTILDVGAATGDFLSIARAKGLDVSGIELSAYAVAKAKEKFGLDLRPVGLLDFPDAESYSLVHMNHVFEHFTQPHAALERLGSLLAPDGLVYVEVPFQFSVFEVLKYRLFGAKKRFDVFSLHHPIFYRPATLRRVFYEHGFECAHLRVFDATRHPSGSLAQRLKRTLWSALARAGQGLFIEALFQKRAQAR